MLRLEGLDPSILKPASGPSPHAELKWHRVPRPTLGFARSALPRERVRSLAHRAISLRYGSWSLSGHSGLWQAVCPADLWVHGLSCMMCGNTGPRCAHSTPLGRRAKPKVRCWPHPGMCRAHSLLAGSPNGCTESMMIAQGFSVEACTALSARSSRLSRAAEAPEVIRVHVTEAGRPALE